MAVKPPESSTSSTGSTAPSSGVGRGKRKSRAERNLPDLTKAQTIARQLVQQAQNSCRFIKDNIDEGNMPTSEVLQACSVLTGALAGMLGKA